MIVLTSNINNKKIPWNKEPIIKLKCLGCNKTFEVPTWRSKQNPKYRSYDCYWDNKTISKEQRDEHSKRLKEYYKTNKSYWTGKKRGATPIEVRKKLSEANRGENAYQWKGGISKLYDNLRKTDMYKEWCKKIYIRDDYTCQLCNLRSKKDKSVVLNVHHKKTVKNIISDNNLQNKWDSYNCKELWDLNNGITLCVECHRKIHFGDKNDNHD